MLIKNNLILNLVIVLFSLLGLPACTNNVNNPNNDNNSQITTQGKQEIKIGGSSSSYGFMQPLGKIYESKVENTKITFQPASQSGAGIAGVKEGILEIASVARELKPEEDPEGQLEYSPIAKDGVVVATHPTVTGVSNLTTEQLKKIYSGAIKNWQELGGENVPIVLLDRPEDESPKKMLRKYYLGKDLKISPDAVSLRTEGDLIDSIQNTPYSIGVFSLGYSLNNNLPVNHLSLDGVKPTVENVATGKYKMVRNYGVVIKKEPSESITSFIDFIYSPEGTDTIKKIGLVPTAK